MRAQLLHLNGPYRGRTMVYPAKTVLFGTAPDAHVCYPADGVVEERHAALAFLEDECAFHLKAIDGSVFVNHQEIREVIIEPGDLLEIGRGGPKVRFRIHAEGARSCKPVHLMLHDAREVGAEAGLTAFAKSLCRDLCTQATWKLRVGVPLLAIVVALGAASLGGFLGSARTALEQDALREGQTTAYQTEIAGIRAQVEAFRREQAGGVTRQEIDELRAELASRATIVDKLVERNAALAKVLDV